MRVTPLIAWATVSIVVVGLVGPAMGVAVGTATVSSSDEQQSGEIDTQWSTATTGESAFTDASTPGVSVVETPTPAFEQGFEGGMATVVESVPGEPVVLLAAYSRYSGDSALEHPLRANINDIVTRSPGLYLAQIVERTDSHESTVRYHTRVLEWESHIQTAMVWGNLRLYPAVTDTDDFEALAALRDDASSRVLDAIARDEPATVSTLADELDRAPSTVSHHLSRLEDAELIERERTGESVQITLAPGIRELLVVEGPVDSNAVGSSALDLVGD